MRLNNHEQDMIKKAFLETFKSGKIYLFGSRVDDSQRGGDIDLYLRPDIRYNDENKKKIKFLIKLDEYIGEQKIDVIMANNRDSLIEQEALKYGVIL